MATARPKGKGYEIRVFCGVDADKKRIDRSRTWVPEKKYCPKQLKQELERQKALFEEEVKGGKAYDKNGTVKSFSQKQIAVWQPGVTRQRNPTRQSR